MTLDSNKVHSNIQHKCLLFYLLWIIDIIRPTNIISMSHLTKHRMLPVFICPLPINSMKRSNTIYIICVTNQCFYSQENTADNLTRVGNKDFRNVFDQFNPIPALLYRIRQKSQLRSYSGWESYFYDVVNGLVLRISFTEFMIAFQG